MALWKAAQPEAAAVLVRDRPRMGEEIEAEHEMRGEALALLEGHEAETRLLARRVAALDEAKRHLQAVRADVYWERVVHEIWRVMSADGALGVGGIEQRPGADLVEECKGHREEWNHATLRKKINQRIFHKRLFASVGPGRYRRRRPEDDVQASAGSAA